MRVFQQEEPEYGKGAAVFALGALGGLAIGMVLSRRQPPQRAAELGNELRERVRTAGERARTAARRLKPARLRRLVGEQADLAMLEDRVLEVFLADETLSERGIDVGAISAGIIELSGSVWSEAEADHAVSVTGRIPGVRTVVNRMDVEAVARRGGSAAAGLDASARWSGRGVGMDGRRQGGDTDPDRPDDSREQRDEALERADYRQWQEEGLAARNSKMTSRSEVQDPDRTRFDEDELDNQDPHGKNAAFTLDKQPQKLNTASRVGDGAKSATHLQLESKDVPAKPHADAADRAGEDAGRK